MEDLQDNNAREWNEFSDLNRKWALSVLSNKLNIPYNDHDIDEYDSEYDEYDIDIFANGNADYDELLRLFPNMNQNKKRALSPKQIDSLPTYKYNCKYKDKDHHHNGKSPDSLCEKNELNCFKCIFCLTNFNTGDTIKQLPCKHIFHSNEIDKWLTMSNLCPICRVPIQIKIQSV